MTVVIATCTNRKAAVPAAQLCAASLSVGNVSEVAGEWARRLASAAPSRKASVLYQGRAFRDAQAAAETAGAKLAVISAGLGIVDAETPVPSYSLTISAGADCVLDRIEGRASAARWWSRGVKAAGLGQSLERTVEEAGGLALIAAGGGYLDMIAEEFEALDPALRSRVRIFTRTPAGTFNPRMRPFIMPYDERLDGPDSAMPGTLSDFASRALRDFVTFVLPKWERDDVEGHRAGVVERLADWAALEPKRGASRTDDELLTTIAASWGAAAGRSSRMLRLLRDDLGIACEQTRFRRLFAQVSERQLS